jgi:hypothetical protein
MIFRIAGPLGLLGPQLDEMGAVNGRQDAEQKTGESQVVFTHGLLRVQLAPGSLLKKVSGTLWPLSGREV